MIDFQARRQKVFDRMPANSIAIMKSGMPKIRNHDTEYPFRQESAFYYLTGFQESEAIAVLRKTEQDQQFILFCQEKNQAAEQWTGPRVGLAGACEYYGADEAYPIVLAPVHMKAMLKNNDTLYYFPGQDFTFDKKLFSWLKDLRQKNRSKESIPSHFVDLRTIVDELRLIKTSDEMKEIRKACEITVKGHQEAIRRCQPGMKEYELEAILLYEFYRQGSRYPAYPSIVATGKNACTLHYTQNNAVIAKEDLVLIDAGAEYGGYAADVTRTFPASGTFSSPQQALYEVVLAAQMAAIEAIQPGLLWDKLQTIIIEQLVQGLIDLKILNGSLSQCIEEKAYLRFYMHGSGHWLGLDVHDVGAYCVKGKSRALVPGMVFTVEPGLYLPHNADLPEKWKGIGIRIEDDVTVTEKGVEVLTGGVPKTVEAIEKYKYAL